MLPWHLSSVERRITSAEEHAQVLKPTRETEIIREKSIADNEPSGLENDRDMQLQTQKGIDQFAAENSSPAALPENSINNAVKAAPGVSRSRRKHYDSLAWKKPENIGPYRSWPHLIGALRLCGWKNSKESDTTPLWSRRRSIA
jgi:hypothetical protein